MKISWRGELPSLLLLAAMFLMAALSWQSAPDQIPVHWGSDFEPDRYGGKFEGLLLMPLFACGLYLFLLFVAPRIDPGRANYPRFAGTYAAMRIAVIAFMAGFDALVHLQIRGVAWNVRMIMPVLMGVLFIVIGNLMGKLRPNFFVGFRTPWTLTSKLAWNRTNRAGGWLFILCGFLFLIAALVGRPWALTVPFFVMIGGVVVLTAYSYLLWRRDPDKVPPAGTEPS